MDASHIETHVTQAPSVGILHKRGLARAEKARGGDLGVSSTELKLVGDQQAFVRHPRRFFLTLFLTNVSPSESLSQILSRLFNYLYL